VKELRWNTEHFLSRKIQFCMLLMCIIQNSCTVEKCNWKGMRRPLIQRFVVSFTPQQLASNLHIALMVSVALGEGLQCVLQYWYLYVTDILSTAVKIHIYLFTYLFNSKPIIFMVHIWNWHDINVVNFGLSVMKYLYFHWPVRLL
jgi:hypothetical protein